ncbi:hypothetical protein ACHWQZ_G018467 [Mnemiopsis leidyi]
MIVRKFATASILLVFVVVHGYDDAHWSDSFGSFDWDWDPYDLTEYSSGVDTYSSSNFWDEWTWDDTSFGTVEGWGDFSSQEIEWSDWVDTSQWTSYDWTSWGDWDSWDWGSWDIASDWESFGFEEYFWNNNIDFPSPTGDYGGGLLPFEEMKLLNIDQYWTNNEDLNWCKDEWYPERVEDPDWADMIKEFFLSGNITNWCIFPQQLMVISDLRHLNLNDPNALPRMFREIEGHCTEGMCRRQLEKRKRLKPDKLTERVWKLMAVYTQMGCPECFCDSKEKKELETAMAITKDHLKQNEIMSFNTTSNTPKDVETYFTELKKDLGLLTSDLPKEKAYIPLLDMEQAIDGPGRHAVQINKISELQHGIYEFCGK